ncbi:hypothetical protein KM043_015654 [Ampulex compressa]|nr:hypothetical protein KM043_015654 [Ampulex compressa]
MLPPALMYSAPLFFPGRGEAGRSVVVLVVAASENNVVSQVLVRSPTAGRGRLRIRRMQSTRTSRDQDQQDDRGR